MSEKRLLCLGMFEEHSLFPWWWQGSDGLYHRECRLCGCCFSETAKELVPKSQTIFVDQSEDCAHNWSVWSVNCVPNSHDTYIPPWQYKRECCICGTKQLAEALEKQSE
mgnify:CR=1 FL=1